MAASVAASFDCRSAKPLHRSPQIPVRQCSDRLHLLRSDPAVANNHTGEAMQSSRPKMTGTVRQLKSAPLNKRAVAAAVADALQQDFGRFAVKHRVIANAAGAASARTAKAWTSQESCPALEYFLELGKHSPAIQKMTMHLWNLDPDIDPEYQRAFMDLVRAVQSGGQR